MRKVSIVICFIVALFSSTAYTELIDNHDGTVTQIRNDGTVLMWLKDVNYAKTSGYDADGFMNWNDAMNWANNLVFAGYDEESCQ